MGLKGVLLLGLTLAATAQARADEYEDLSEALTAARRGASLKGRVGTGLGEQAVGELVNGEQADLKPLFAVAKAGGLELEATVELMRRFSASPTSEIPTGQILLDVDPALALKAMDAAPGYVDALLRLLKFTRDGPPPTYPRTLLALHANRTSLTDLLAQWGAKSKASPHLLPFLRALRRSGRPVDAFDALADATLPAEAQGEAATTITVLVRLDPVRRHLVQRLKAGDSPPLLYRAIAGVPRSHLGKFGPWLVKRLEKESGEALAQGIYAAAQLQLFAALPRIVWAMTDSGPARLAALRVGPALILRARAAGEPYRESARRAVLAALDEDDEVLAAGIYAATQLGLEEPTPRQLQAWARDTKQALVVRSSALRAMPGRLQVNRSNMEPLIDLLNEPAIARDAHQALLALSGVRLPPRPRMWKTWLEADIHRRINAPPPRPRPEPEEPEEEEEDEEDEDDEEGGDGGDGQRPAEEEDDDDSDRDGSGDEE